MLKLSLPNRMGFFIEIVVNETFATFANDRRRWVVRLRVHDFDVTNLHMKTFWMRKRVPIINSIRLCVLPHFLWISTSNCTCHTHASVVGHYFQSTHWSWLTWRSLWRQLLPQQRQFVDWRFVRVSIPCRLHPKSTKCNSLHWNRSISYRNAFEYVFACPCNARREKLNSNCRETNAKMFSILPQSVAFVATNRASECLCAAMRFNVFTRFDGIRTDHITYRTFE